MALTKADLAERLFTKFGVSKRDAKLIVEAFFEEIRAALEAIWAGLDSLFEEMSPVDWDRPHGADWVFADLPYHLFYIDRLFVSQPIQWGEDLPENERFVLKSFKEIDVWNQARFAARPEGQRVEVSLEQMRASREAVRQVMAGMTDTDLERPSRHCEILRRDLRPA